MGTGMHLARLVSRHRSALTVNHCWADRYRFFCYGWSIGPLPYVICSEVGSAQLRQKTIALARGSYYVTQVINTVVGPYVLNPTAGNLKGKAAFLPAGLMVLLLIWSYFRLPETKGRSFEELDIMFGELKMSQRWIWLTKSSQTCSDSRFQFLCRHYRGGVRRQVMKAEEI